MAYQFTYDSSVDNTSITTGGGGGGGGAVISNVPTARTISFTISSSPNNSAILIDNVQTGRVTPYTFTFLETELLSPKRISVVNGSRNSVETYIISAETIINSVSAGGTNYGGGGVPDPYSGGYSRPGDITPGNINYTGNQQEVDFK